MAARLERGFGLLLYAVAALAVIGALGGLYYKVNNDGYQRGKGEVKAEWEAANRAERDRQEKERLARQALAAKQVAALQQSERKASDYETRYREANRRLRNAALAECAPTPQPRPENAPAAPVASPDGGLRLTPSFVLRFDAAWTGRDGQPVYPDTGESATAAARASAAEPAEVLDTHAENASRCSKNSRQLAELIGLIRKLQAGK